MNSESEAGTYIDEYSGFGAIDAIISVYLLSNGAFNYFSYGHDSEDSKYLWLMFLLAIFINMIVFMNMLIAIMGDTFSSVMES